MNTTRSPMILVAFAACVSALARLGERIVAYIRSDGDASPEEVLAALSLKSARIQSKTETIIYMAPVLGMVRGGVLPSFKPGRGAHHKDDDVESENMVKGLPSLDELKDQNDLGMILACAGAVAYWEGIMERKEPIASAEELLEARNVNTVRGYVLSLVCTAKEGVSDEGTLEIVKRESSRVAPEDSDSPEIAVGAGFGPAFIYPMHGHKIPSREEFEKFMQEHMPLMWAAITDADGKLCIHDLSSWMMGPAVATNLVALGIHVGALKVRVSGGGEHLLVAGIDTPEPAEEEGGLPPELLAKLPPELAAALRGRAGGRNSGAGAALLGAMLSAAGGNGAKSPRAAKLELLQRQIGEMRGMLGQLQGGPGGESPEDPADVLGQPDGGPYAGAPTGDDEDEEEGDGDTDDNDDDDATGAPSADDPGASSPEDEERMIAKIAEEMAGGKN